MVEFGLKLEDNKVAEWTDHYIEYEKLKAILKRCTTAVKRHNELAAKDPEKAAKVERDYLDGVVYSVGNSREHLTEEEFIPGPPVSPPPRVALSTAEQSLLSPPSALPDEKQKLLEANRLQRYGTGGSSTTFEEAPSRIFSRTISTVSGLFTKPYEKQIRESIREKVALEEEFEQQLTRDIERVNGFYRERHEELQDRLDILKESVAQTLGFKYQRRRGNSVTSECDEEHSQETYLDTPLICKNRKSVGRQMDDLAKAIRNRLVKGQHTRRESEASVLKLPSDDYDDDGDNTGALPPEKVKEAESIQRALVDQYRTAKLLHNFAIMNYTGFVKIVKKHNKITKENAEKYKEATKPDKICHEGKEVDEFASSLERLYANWFCDRNSSEAQAQLLPKKGDGLQTDWSQLRLGYRMGMCSILGLWVCWDCVWGLVRDGNTTIGARSAFPVFRACAGLLMVEWFWGCSVWVWSRYRVNYIYIMDLDPHLCRSATLLFNEAVDDTLMFLGSMLLYYKAGVHDIPGDLPAGVFPAFIVLYSMYRLVFPLKLRMPMWKAIWQVVTAPTTSPAFFHSYIGDIFTSMVKVFQDLVWTFFFLIEGDWLVSEDSKHASKHAWSRASWYSNVLIPLVTLLPLWIRFNQCLRRYMDTRNRFPHLANAAKYALSQTVTLFGAFHPLSLRNRGESTVFQLFWSFAFVGSSLYSFVWDVYMDWGLGRPSFNMLGPRLMYPKRSMYYAVICIDLVLRFAWVLTLIPPHSGAKFALPAYLTAVSMLLELCRRTLWGFLRLENEHRSNTAGYRRVGFVPLHFSTGHAHGYKQDKEHLGFSVLLEVAAVTIVVVGAAISSVVVAQHATERNGLEL